VNYLIKEGNVSLEKSGICQTWVIHKIIEISKNPELGKPMRNVLKGKRRIQIGPFVLFYSIDKENEIVTFLEFEHHDDAYH